jgi:hypothetical protein
MNIFGIFHKPTDVKQPKDAPKQLHALEKDWRDIDLGQIIRDARLSGAEMAIFGNITDYNPLGHGYHGTLVGGSEEIMFYCANSGNTRLEQYIDAKGPDEYIGLYGQYERKGSFTVSKVDIFTLKKIAQLMGYAVKK